MVPGASEFCYVLSLLLSMKCQHVVVTDGVYLSHRDKLKLLPTTEVPAELPKTKTTGVLAFLLLSQQAWTDSPTSRSQRVWDLAGRSRLPAVRSPDSLPYPQMGSQSQTQSLPLGQAEGLLPTCALQRKSKKRSCIFKLPVKGVQDKVALRYMGCRESPLTWRGPAQRPIQY